MKDIFKGYYQLEKEEFKDLWENSLFIFDTNVLLNLYRYQSSTRDALLKVMEQLDERAWIPYHVGLEFQRNRLKIIAEQHKRFSEVRGIVRKLKSGMQNEFDGLQLKKRHSHINPDQLLANIEKVQKEFFEELNKLEEKSISVNSKDEIRDRIDVLFQNSIGLPFEDQKSLDDLFSEGEDRYKNNIPPGYKDSSKDEKNPDEFTYLGLTYKRKYGDLIIWKQIISHAAVNELKNINDSLMIRGLYTLIKAGMLKSHHQFFEEAIYSLFITMEVSYRLVLRELKSLGNENPTSQDAMTYIHDAFYDIYIE